VFNQSMLSKNSMKKLVSMLLILLSSSVFASADVEAGKKKADVFCAGCHGPTGKAQLPQNPNLQGQNIIYTINQLKAFKDGRRNNLVMKQMAAMLSEQDMLNIATFYRKVKD
jgi:cytochrome c553